MRAQRPTLGLVGPCAAPIPCRSLLVQSRTASACTAVTTRVGTSVAAVAQTPEAAFDTKNNDKTAINYSMDLYEAHGPSAGVDIPSAYVSGKGPTGRATWKDSETSADSYHEVLGQSYSAATVSAMTRLWRHQSAGVLAAANQVSAPSSSQLLAVLKAGSATPLAEASAALALLCEAGQYDTVVQYGNPLLKAASAAMPFFPLAGVPLVGRPSPPPPPAVLHLDDLTADIALSVSLAHISLAAGGNRAAAAATTGGSGDSGALEPAAAVGSSGAAAGSGPGGILGSPGGGWQAVDGPAVGAAGKKPAGASGSGSTGAGAGGSASGLEEAYGHLEAALQVLERHRVLPLMQQEVAYCLQSVAIAFAEEVLRSTPPVAPLPATHPPAAAAAAAPARASTPALAAASTAAAATAAGSAAPANVSLAKQPNAASAGQAAAANGAASSSTTNNNAALAAAAARRARAVGIVRGALWRTATTTPTPTTPAASGSNSSSPSTGSSKPVVPSGTALATSSEVCHAAPSTPGPLPASSSSGSPAKAVKAGAASAGALAPPAAAPAAVATSAQAGTPSGLSGCFWPPELTADERMELMAPLRGLLAASEHITIYGPVASGQKPYAAVQLSDQELYDLAIAHLAQGVTTGWPQHVLQALSYFERVASQQQKQQQQQHQQGEPDGTGSATAAIAAASATAPSSPAASAPAAADVSFERSVCEALLGRRLTAAGGGSPSDAASSSSSPPPGPGVFPDFLPVSYMEDWGSSPDELLLLRRLEDHLAGLGARQAAAVAAEAAEGATAFTVDELPGGLEVAAAPASTASPQSAAAAHQHASSSASKSTSSSRGATSSTAAQGAGAAAASGSKAASKGGHDSGTTAAITGAATTAVSERDNDVSRRYGWAESWLELSVLPCFPETSSPTGAAAAGLGAGAAAAGSVSLAKWFSDPRVILFNQLLAVRSGEAQVTAALGSAVAHVSETSRQRLWQLWQAAAQAVTAARGNHQHQQPAPAGIVPPAPMLPPAGPPPPPAAATAAPLASGLLAQSRAALLDVGPRAAAAASAVAAAAAAVGSAAASSPKAVAAAASRMVPSFVRLPRWGGTSGGGAGAGASPAAAAATAVAAAPTAVSAPAGVVAATPVPAGGNGRGDSGNDAAVPTTLSSADTTVPRPAQATPLPHSVAAKRGQQPAGDRPAAAAAASRQGPPQNGAGVASSPGLAVSGNSNNVVPFAPSAAVGSGPAAAAAAPPLPQRAAVPQTAAAAAAAATDAMATAAPGTTSGAVTEAGAADGNDGALWVPDAEGHIRPRMVARVVQSYAASAAANLKERVAALPHLEWTHIDEQHAREAVRRVGAVAAQALCLGALAAYVGHRIVSSGGLYGSGGTGGAASGWAPGLHPGAGGLAAAAAPVLEAPAAQVAEAVRSVKRWLHDSGAGRSGAGGRKSNAAAWSTVEGEERLATATTESVSRLAALYGSRPQLDEQGAAALLRGWAAARAAAPRLGDPRDRADLLGALLGGRALKRARAEADRGARLGRRVDMQRLEVEVEHLRQQHRPHWGLRPSQPPAATPATSASYDSHVSYDEVAVTAVLVTEGREASRSSPLPAAFRTRERIVVTLRREGGARGALEGHRGPQGGAAPSSSLPTSSSSAAAAAVAALHHGGGSVWRVVDVHEAAPALY